MAMDFAATVAAIRKFTDESYEGFTGFPANDVETANAWADVAQLVGSAVVPPSLGVGAAIEALRVSLLGMTVPGAAIPVWDIGWTAFGAAVALGQPTTGVVNLPPPLPMSVLPPTMLTIFAAGVAGATAEAQAVLMATLIIAWMSTGTSTPTGATTPVPWS